MTLHIHKLQEHIIHSTAFENAQLISNAISEFRTLYTSEVIETIQDHGIPVTHDYQRGKSVPLPASFSMLLGKRIAQSGNGAKSSLYSPYPFPWRSEVGGLKDDFAKRAWQTLLDQSKDFYYEFIEQNGVETIRYARADRMHEACISCHNNHPASPKQDWKTGDLRGLLEVTIPLKKVTLITHNDIELTIIIFLVLTLLGVYGMYRIFIDHSSFTKNLENAVAERTLQLEKEKEKAEQANQAKTQFLARMSHELRTPMNSILGFGQLLELDLKEDEQKKNCQQILSAGKHLLDLINEILDLELIETGKTPCNIETIDLDTVIKESLALSSSYARQNNIHINDYIDCNLKILADYRLSKQVLVNLISNAIKYNRENGTVTIDVELKSEPTVRISIKDTGQGLTKNQLEKLFQPFERLDADKECIEGVGIGLVITKRLTELMNGKIGLESTPGKGSTFWIELPRQQTN